MSTWPDCVPGDTNTECFDQSPSYYETLQTANIDGSPGDELLGRLDDGLRVKSFDALDNPDTVDDGDLQYLFGWNQTSAPGAINGTESSSTNGSALYRNGGDANVIEVIGPVGPDLGKFTLTYGDPANVQHVVVDQSAPQPRDQQVLFTAVDPNGMSTFAIDAGPGTAVIDALKTYTFSNAAWSSLPKLTDLAGTSAAWASTPGRWGSIRTGDIDGDGKDEVLALDGQGLQAWSYNPTTKAWSKLQPSTPLALASDPWLTHPEYYSTIQTGDVDGDGHDDVVARGPAGIRTWFYNRRSTGGWERYLPEGYPDFPTRACPAGVTGPCGQAAAYVALKGLAKTATGAPIPLREVWASATNVPAVAI